MASQYFAILTDYGTTAFANALSSKQPLQLTTFAVGDGNGQAVTPTANRTALAREKHRAPVSAVSLDPRNNKQVIVELTIPENVGDFYIREMGVFDNQNKLVAYANCPESFKPTESSGSGKVQVLRMILKVSSSNAVTLSIDHSVIFVTRQQLNPKTITATTQNGFDETGHTHEIDRATTAKAGIVKLNNAINSTSETEAATPKAVKTVKDQLDSVSRNQANYIPNSKKSSSITSNSADTVATSSAVKQVNDKITPLNFYKVNVKGGATPVTFDLSNREHWIAEIGSVYKGKGHYQLGLHNNATSTITNLPLNDKSPVQLDISVMGAHSLIRCHYIYLNRTFTSKFDWNKATFPLMWFEDVKLNSEGKVPRNTVFAGSLESDLRVVARRNSTTGAPYFWMVDNGVNIDEDITTSKMISSIESRAGKNGTEDGEVKSVIRTHLKQDKNVEVEISTRNASNIWNPMLRMFSKTNNVSVGNGSDNGRDRLQVAGTIKATAPADNANNDQVPNTFWVRRLLNNAISTINNAISGKVSKSGDTMTGNLVINTADSLLKGKRNGADKYAVRLRNNTSDDAVFVNYTYDTVLELLQHSVRSNKTLIATGMIIENSDYAGLSLKNLSGRYARIEGNPHSAANMLTFVYREANGSNINTVFLPRKSGTLLLDNDLVGEVGFFARATPPSGWLKANGAAVSRTTYAALFAAIGTTFGAGDGRTTFNLPDLRGEFLRGLDDGRNIDPNRRLGSWQKGTIEGFDGLDATSVFGVGLVRDSAWNTLTLEESVTLVGADHTTYDDVREIALKWAGGGGARATNNSADREGGFWTKNNKNPVKRSHFAGMTRPRNIALLACIKY